MTVMVNRRQQRLSARLAELWRYRDLVRNLALRDLKARYKSSVLGFVWSLLNPLLMTVVFTIVFTVMLPSNIEKYPVFILVGLLPWNWFSSSLFGSVQSIVGNANLVKKVYFPRETLPIAVVVANGVNFLLAGIVLFALILIYRIPITAWVFFLPVLVVIQFVLTLGLGLFVAALIVRFRDTAVILEVILQAWFFLTPVVYDMRVLPEAKTIMGVDVEVRRWAYILNPIGSLIASYRDILYWTTPPGLDFVARTAVESAIILVLGYLFFSRLAPTFGEDV